MAGETFDNRDGKIWFNGHLVPWRDANIHVLNHGLHYGSSVFEGARAYNRKIFFISFHKFKYAHNMVLTRQNFWDYINQSGRYR